MKRRVWLLLAAFSTALAPVWPMSAEARMPVAEMSCGASQSPCGDQHSVPCPDQPARECATCPLSCVNGCLAVLSTADLAPTALSPVARLDNLVEKGLQRADPPQLPPPRLTG